MFEKQSLKSIEFVSKGDTVFMKDRDEREEYILNESGIIWRGTHEKMKPTPWNFAQVCLKLSDACLL